MTFDKDGYNEDGETLYMTLGWQNNVKNCSIDESRTVMISDDQYEYEYDILAAGVILGELSLQDESSMGSCGKWHWITFKNTAMAMAFKLKWE